MDKLLERLWNFVARSSSSLTMQVRLFRLITLVTGLLSLMVVLPTNLLQNLPLAVNLILVVFGLFAFICYWESLRGRQHFGIFLIGFLMLMDPAWFFNGGSQGSVPYYVFPALLIPMVLWRGRFRWGMTALVVVNLVALLLLEHHYPSLVVPFQRPVDRMLDLLTGAVCSCLMLSTIVWVILSNYDWEQTRLSRFARELATSEKNYREVVENARSIILRLDAQGRIRFFNKYAEDLFGFKRVEVIGRHVVGTIVPAMSGKGEDLSGMVQQILQTPEAYAKVENENVCQDGRRLRIAWTNQPVYDEQGKFAEFLCVGTDITERAELMEKLQLTQTTMDAAAEAIVWLRGDGEIIYANTAAAALGITRNASPPPKLHEVLDDLTPADWNARWQELKERRSLAFESCLLCPDGSKRPVELLVTHMGLAGNEYATVFFHDLTVRQQAEEKRRQQEQQMLQLQKLESLGILAGGIAHDFNNLLTAVMGNISLAKLGIPPGAEEHQMLDEAEKASFHAKDLTAQLLTFSRGGKPVKRSIALNQIIRDSARLALRGGSAKCEVQVPDDLFPVEADATQLAQVFNNLLINAQQAMPGGGLIAIEASNVELEAPNNLALAAGLYVEVKVRDQGEGIPQATLPRIFDPYFTTKRTGSGLGLAVVHSILKNHQGAIEVESQLGRGTTFTLWLPATRLMTTTTASSAEAGAAAISARRSRVLIMDDEDMVRKLLTRMLQRLGCEVTAASDGAAAVALFDQACAAGQKFDLVIMDLTIPGGMGGQEAIQHLRKLDPEVKAVVSSGYSSSPVMAEYQQYGFVGVVVKPFTTDQLLATLQPLLKS